MFSSFDRFRRGKEEEAIEAAIREAGKRKKSFLAGPDLLVSKNGGAGREEVNHARETDKFPFV